MRKRRKKTFAAVQAPAPVNLMSEPVKRKRGRPRKQRPEPGARLEIWWGIVSRTTGKLLRVYEQQAEAENINRKVFLEKVVIVQVSYCP